MQLKQEPQMLHSKINRQWWTKKKLSVLALSLILMHFLPLTSTDSRNRKLQIEESIVEDSIAATAPCLTALAKSDTQPRDAQLDKNEYLDFLNILTQGDYDGLDFEDLPLDLKTNYDNFAKGGQGFSCFGAQPAEAFLASEVQKQFLRDFCLKVNELLGNEVNRPITSAASATNEPLNRYVGGCLREKLKELGSDVIPKRRACNSHDSPEIIEQGLCEVSQFDYMEIRITPGNWDSANFYALIIQIILSELLFVPVSIDTGTGGELNFYDVNNGFGYNSVSHNYEALANSNKVADCRDYSDNTTCAHVFPEFWQAYQNSQLNYDEVEEVFNSMVGYLSWYVPKHVVEDDMTLMSYIGYFGKDNKEKLAKLFKRPTTWGDYCASKSNCTTKDDYASGPPGVEEKDLYFFEGDGEKYYTGFFNATERNDCTLNSDCTGHFVDYPCSWGAFTDQITHWNNVSLEHEKEYTYSELLQIFKAANATNSSIIATWWYPDSALEPYDYWSVSLPKATLECQSNRFLPKINRCSLNKTERLGNELGSCGYQSQSLSTLIANSVKKDFLQEVNEALRSPAYETLREIRVQSLDISAMLRNWTMDQRTDSSGYNAREAVCTWLADSYMSEDKSKSVKRFIPNTYPREFPATSWELKWYNYAAMIFGIIVLIAVLLITAAVHYYRSARIIRMAQPEFINLFALGYFMVCIAAILCAIMPTDATCIARQWLISLGYTQGMVPLLMKVSVINLLMNQAKKMKRFRVSKRSLYGYVIACTIIISAYLLAWTFIDPQSQSKEFKVISEGDEKGDQKNLVETEFYCASSSPIWIAVAVAWEAVFMLAAAVLSFQSRNVRSDMNESRELGRMAYIHLLFFIVRIIIALSQPVSMDIILSFLLSLDSLLSILLYTGPKIWGARKEKNSPPRSSCAASSLGTFHGPLAQSGVSGVKVVHCATCTCFNQNHQNSQTPASCINTVNRLHNKTAESCTMDSENGKDHEEETRAVGRKPSILRSRIMSALRSVPSSLNIAYNIENEEENGSERSKSSPF